MATTYSTYNSMTPFMAGTNCPPPGPSTPTPSQSRITYFMTRNNGLPVPLIPADELPFTIKLQNVPRVLSPEQTYGLTYVGTAPYIGSTFKLETGTMERSNSNPPSDISHARNQSNTGVKFLAPDALARQAMQGQFNFAPPQTNSAGLLPKRPISAASAATSWRRPDNNNTTSDATQSVIDAILASPSGAETAQRTGYLRPTSSPPPSGITPDQEKKEYCTHWILQGWCAYEQQGCRYKHEMLDKEGLAKIGIRHVPRWWLERNAPVKFGMGAGGLGSGEAKGIVGGVLRKPEEWLKMRKESASDADSERSSTTEVGSEESTDGTSEEETPVKKVGKKAEKVEEVIKSPIITATRPPTPAESKVEEKGRKSSTGSDLIDFAPLLPTPAPNSPVQILKRNTKSEEVLKTVEKPVDTTKFPSTTKTTRIFVPAGESPEKHIAQVKQRERVVRSSKSPRATSPTTEAEKPTSPKDTVAKTQVAPPKEKVIKTEVSSPKEGHPKPEGLTSSRWASKDGEKSPRKLTKSGCRPRRPASTSASTSPVAKKEKDAGGKEGEKKCLSQ